jgi:hypothetical protein
MKTRDKQVTWQKWWLCPSQFAAFHNIGLCQYSLCQYVFTILSSLFLSPVPVLSLQLSHAHVVENFSGSGYGYFCWVHYLYMGSHDPRHWGAALIVYCNTITKTTLAGGTGIVPYIAKQKRLHSFKSTWLISGHPYGRRRRLEPTTVTTGHVPSVTWLAIKETLLWQELWYTSKTWLV